MRRKVTVVGAGNVGATTAQRIFDKGYADVVLVDPQESWVVHAEDSESQQGYTPLEGQELGARVKTTFLRGQRIYDDGTVIGEPTGQYLKRPC